MVFVEIDFKKIPFDIADNQKMVFYATNLQKQQLIADIHTALANVSIQRIDEARESWKQISATLKPLTEEA